jgi:prepilin-type N-terminal cleavage/methylation domain-containing protein
MRQQQRGFSLIELLFALMILTLVITTTLAVFVERTKRLRQANETILAYQVLANEAELQRRVAFNDVASSTSFTTPTDLIAPLAPYVTKIDVTSTQVGIKTVKMSILWSHGQHHAELALKRVDTGGENLW